MSSRIALLGALCAMLPIASLHATDTTENLPPRYDSRFNTERPANQRYASPEDDGRPGEKYYFDAVRAVTRKDFGFAVDMYEVSASWAYKPAQYNLGVMYLKGEGVPVDRSRAMAWFALAAERGDTGYVQARELLYADLGKDEFAHANEIWRELKTTYGDDAALARAKMRWAHVKAEMTGSRVGMPGNLKVGGGSSAVKPVAVGPGGRSGLDGFATAAFGVLKGGSEDGAIAYRQFRESNDPYDPKFEWRLSPNATGSVIVDPLLPATAKGDAAADTTPAQQHRFY
ncbi:TPR repeat protein [Dokdonella fugitiva]|uniref:TPR repeat protein n=1 Tax=Dokdonella fugitiva TaxID=328517 RepID=A0A839EQZ0_9GAMM|nr:sel1 repeat family protein [Dokdonella fugitiva]MBA8886757.1 TPR repeat protein [Dokdonella fugitiva]